MALKPLLCIRWRNGFGDDVLFWTDNWLSCGTLRQWATIDLFEELLQTKTQIPKTDSIEHTVVYLHWKHPRSGVCKVNTDGSRINVTGISGAGGVLRDSNGAWIQGFSVNLGASSILEAEL
ncbi:reverse mRNAase [Salix suchowensis]|nr:reverse mRNAase [Salix suchowensis]